MELGGNIIAPERGIVRPSRRDVERYGSRRRGRDDELEALGVSLSLSLSKDSGEAAAPAPPAPAPSDWGSDLKLWLKGDAGVTTDTGGIRDWADSTPGSSVVASQATSSKRPDVGATLNGIPGVDFNVASGDWLTIASGQLSVAASDYLVWFVLDVETVTATLRVFFDVQTGRLFFSNQTTTNSFVNYNDGSSRSTGVVGITGPQSLIFDLRATTNGRVYRNGSQLGSALNYTQRAIGGTIGIGSDFAGTSNCEIIYYEMGIATGPTDQRRSDLLGYISTRFGI